MIVVLVTAKLGRYQVKWEYKTAQLDLGVSKANKFDSADNELVLNHYGDQGWELVGFTSTDAKMYLIFKRHKDVLNL